MRPVPRLATARLRPSGEAVTLALRAAIRGGIGGGAGPFVDRSEKWTLRSSSPASNSDASPGFRPGRTCGTVRALFPMKQSTWSFRRPASVAGALVAVAVLGCTPPRATTVPRPADDRPAPYAIGAGDVLDVRFYRTPELNVSVPVRSDGKITLDLVGEVDVAGRAPEAVASELVDRYAAELDRPRVAVIVRKFGGKVYVGGEVKNPARVSLSPGMTALQAIDTAGGLLKTAQVDWIVLIRKTGDSYQGIRLELQDVLSGDDPSHDVVLQAGDVVHVPAKPIANLNVIVEQYIRNMLPIQPSVAAAGF